MKNFLATVMSAGAGATSTLAASQTGDKILTYTTLVINATILITNAAIDIYRKWRDRDADLKEKKRGKGDEKND